MKKTIFKTAIIAVFAIALIAGSALAAPVYIEGRIAFTGEAKALYQEGFEGNVDKMYGFGMILGPGINDEDLDPKDWEYPGSYVTLLRSQEFFNGDFREHVKVPGDENWGIPAATVPDYFPTENGILFRNDVTLEALNNIIIENVLLGVGPAPEADLGWLGGFDFIITSLDHVGWEANGGPQSSVTLFMTGIIRHDDFLDTAATYSFTFNQVTQGNYIVTFDINALGEAPPEVPEPGTLVLLGTGLLGAALVARRKMKK